MYSLRPRSGSLCICGPRRCGATSPVDRDRLARRLGGPDLAWLVDRVRRRMARAEPLTGPVTLSDPTPTQREAAERLLGRAPGAGRSLHIRLDAVDAVLRRSGAGPDGLAAAVTALTGPVTRLADLREQEEHAWCEAYAPLDGLIRSGRPELADWADGCVAAGSYAGSHAPRTRQRKLQDDTAETGQPNLTVWLRGCVRGCVHPPARPLSHARVQPGARWRSAPLTSGFAPLSAGDCELPTLPPSCTTRPAGSTDVSPRNSPMANASPRGTPRRTRAAARVRRSSFTCSDSMADV